MSVAVKTGERRRNSLAKPYLFWPAKGLTEFTDTLNTETTLIAFKKDLDTLFFEKLRRIVFGE